MLSLKPLNAQDCLTSWNASHSAKWRLSLHDFEVQLKDDLLVPEFCGHSESGFVIAKRSPQGRLFPGVENQTLIIASITDPTLLAEIKEKAKEAGFTRLALGTDENHLVPGLIVEEGWQLGDRLKEAMVSTGWEKGEHIQVDLERDLGDYELPLFCNEAIMSNNAQVWPAHAENEEALEAFLIETFPGRWTYDVMAKFRSGEPHQIDLLFFEGEVVGFSCTQNESSRNPIGGARWRLDLGDQWASLGPIGVSEKVRGKRLGHALLGFSLHRLALEGARRTIIDWTTLVDFYGVHGFEVNRTYETWFCTL
jgi:GNAT superfamily N-acetyltransferase